ncbi:MAG: hypothetical protein M0Q95_01940 [Porticoccaceae bacterium]|nr:hypothetical protein [Porticoccaceae bacterium]
MIKENDIYFHTPSPTPFDWAETGFFNFYIPEKNILGIVYIVHRSGIGATIADIEIIDRMSADTFDPAYIDMGNHYPIPDKAENFALANGLSFEAKSIREYLIKYNSKDVDIDLHYTSCMEPFDIHDPAMDPMATPENSGNAETTGFGAAYSAHFDMAVNVTGSLRIGKDTYPVNCTSTMDHSWGPRPESNISPILWLNAHFDDGYGIHAIFSYDPHAPKGKQHIFRHGYALVNGVVRGATAGTVSTDRDGLVVNTTDVSIVDIDGTRHSFKGQALNQHHWRPYGNNLSPLAMMRWQGEGRENGIGTYMEGFPLNTLRR